MYKTNLIIPSLVFHSVRKGAGQDLYALEPSYFDEIIAMITEKFGGTISLKDLVISDDGTANQKGVLVTFDDGYDDHLEVVLPILQKYKAKATFFLLPKYFGKQNTWDHRSKVILNHLSIEQAKKLVRAEQTIGSHGLTHNSLLKFSDLNLRNELIESKKMLEDLLQVEVNSFSYPYGDFDQEIAKLSSNYYKYSFATNKETNPNWNQFGYSQIQRERILSNMSIKDIESLIVKFNTRLPNALGKI